MSKVPNKDAVDDYQAATDPLGSALRHSNIRIVVVTNGDAESQLTWSGTPFNAVKELRGNFQDVYVVRSVLFDVVFPFFNRFARKLGLDLMREPLVTQALARMVDRRLRDVSPDVVVSIGATHKIGDLQSSIPVVHVSDALFGTIINELSRFSRLSKRSRRLGDALQQRALDRSEKVLLSSEWARHDALERYAISPARVDVVPLGANIDDPGAVVLSTPKQNLRLLFIGTDWTSKGGEKTVQVLKKIQETVPGATLDIVGCDPGFIDVPGVTVHGFLSKDDQEQAAKLTSLYSQAAFLIVLSEEEAFGLVFCEAAAYGLPAVARAVGGVPTIVRDGASGILFPIITPPDKIADRIVALWSNRASYEEARRVARAEYTSRLNWSAWGKSISRIIHDVSTNARSARS